MEKAHSDIKIYDFTLQEILNVKTFIFDVTMVEPFYITCLYDMGLSPNPIIVFMGLLELSGK